MCETHSIRPRVGALMMLAVTAFGAFGTTGAGSCAPNETKESTRMKIQPDTGNQREVLIEFMFIDLSVCDRCLGTDRNLEAAVGIAADALTAAEIEVEVRRTRVKTEEQAMELRFVSSPTIRVNGHDIAFVTRESICGACSDLGDGPCADDTQCRVWVYNGENHAFSADVEI